MLIDILMDEKSQTRETPEFIADVGPGDRLEPVLTIMLEEDD